MQTQSFHSQKPLFQGFPLCQVTAPLNLPRSPKEEFWVSSGTEVPVFGVETPSQMLPISFGEGDKGGEDQRFNLCKRWGIDSATDYDPYGQALPGRVWNRSGYRFGFNGQELDSELGEVWSSEFWEYDASLGRRWDIDPIKVPRLSPYATFNCNPIYFNDPAGKSGIAYLVKDKETGKTKVVIKSKFVFYHLDVFTKGQIITQKFIDESMQEMEDNWNKIGAKLTYEGQEYDVEFDFSGELVSQAEAEKKASTNKNPELNFVLLHENAGGSHGLGVGTNSFSMYWQRLKDGGYFIASHELIIHGLGWFDYYTNSEHDNDFDPFTKKQTDNPEQRGAASFVYTSKPSNSDWTSAKPSQVYPPSKSDVSNILNKRHFNVVQLMTKGKAVVGDINPDNVIYKQNGDPTKQPTKENRDQRKGNKCVHDAKGQPLKAK